MGGIRRVFAVVAVAAAVMSVIPQQPAAALTAGVLTGSGWMSSASGPGTTWSAVSGTISGTAAGAFGVCSFSSPFNGVDSLLQGQGASAPFGCWGLCTMQFQRVEAQLVMSGNCNSGSSFQLAGFAEPNSVLPTNSYLFQVAGPDTQFGAIAIQGNISFSPGSVVGVDLGTPLPTSTNISFFGTLTGLGTSGAGTCTMDLNGVGSEGLVTGQSTLWGTCIGALGYTSCSITWIHLATHTTVTGNCSGSLGFTLFGVGEIVMGAGGGYSFYGQINVV